MHLYTTKASLREDPVRLFEGRRDACLLTPTATMAEHIRHRLARRGAVVRPDTIVTLSRFLKPYREGTEAAGDATIDICLRRILAERAPEAFRAVAHTRGLRRMLRALIGELSAAGCPEELMPDPVAKVYRELVGELARRGLVLRSEQLRVAAKRIGESRKAYGLFCVHGFYSFTPLEIGVLEALRPSDLAVSIPEWYGAEGIPGLEYGRIEERKSAPETRLTAAASEQAEAEDIARRILECERPFREIGVVVRSQHPYAGLLESTFRRFGIPARFYFPKTLLEHPVARYRLARMDAEESGWEYERLYEAIEYRLSGLGGTVEGDRLMHELLARMPGRGLPEGVEPGLRLPAVPDGVTHGEAFALRELAGALEAWESAVEEAKELSGPEDYRGILETVLEHTPLDDRDQRRNVVHVIDAYEARQWRLPVVFVCGLTERNFPVYHSEHPILDDAARMELRRHGITLRTSAERQREERFLFETACGVATDRLFLSYPKLNSRGDETLASFFLGGARGEREMAVRPRPKLRPSAPQTNIVSKDLLVWIRKNRPSLSPTAIETYLQCPFQFFANHILCLQTAPQRPQERLDFLLQGDILHRTLAECEGSPLFVEEIFGRLFSEACRRESIPDSYRTERVRLELFGNLRRFLESQPLQGGRTVSVERPFELSLSPNVKLRGKIDRVVEAPRGLVVIDYKYSTPERIRQRVRSHERGDLVQGGLYLWAAEKLYKREAAGMLYCGLRNEVSWAGWHLPAFGWQDIGEARDPEELRQIVERSLEVSRQAAVNIQEGELAPLPTDPDKCKWCEARDACRIETAGVPAAVGAGN